MSNPSDSSTGRAPSQSRPFARAEVALDALARIQALDEDAMERYRLAGNAFYAREQRAAAAAAAAGYREMMAEQAPSTPMTSMTQFITSEPDAAARTRSVSAQKTLHPLMLVPEGKEDVQPTHRQSIEAKHERKLFQMMDGEPATPTTSSEDGLSDGNLPTKTKYVFIEKDKKGLASKSPKKKFLGMKIGIPIYKTKTTVVSEGKSSTPDPKAVQFLSGSLPPPKAVQFLGSSSPRSKKSLLPKASRADVTPSLSSKLSQQESLSDTPNDQHKSTLHSNQPKGRTASEGFRALKGKASRALLRGTSGQGNLVKSQSAPHTDHKSSSPPTPPAKNTPPPKDRLLLSNVEEQGLGISAVIRDFAEDSTDVLAMHGGPLTPTRLSGYGSKDNVSFIQKVPSVQSMRGTVEDGSFSAGYNQVTAPHPAAREGRLSEPQMQQPLRLSQLPTPLLKPAFYSPSIYSNPPDMPGFRPSINCDDSIFSLPRKHETVTSHDRQSSEEVPLIFSGSVKELTPTSDRDILTHGLSIQVQPKLQSGQRETLSKTPKRDSGAPEYKFEPLKPLNENNSLRQALAITPLIPGESPDLNKSYCSPFIPHYPSACPTPLKFAQSRLTAPAMPSHSDPGSRFSMLSESTDYDDDNNNNSAVSGQVAAVGSSARDPIHAIQDSLTHNMYHDHRLAVSMLNENFGAVRAHLNTIEHNAGRSCGEVTAAVLKLNDLMELVQAQLINQIEKLMHTNADLRTKVDALVERVKEVESDGKAEGLKERIKELESEHLLLRQQLKAQGTLVTDPRLVAWGGQEMPVEARVLKGMTPEARKKFCEAYAQRQGEPDLSQHPAFRGREQGAAAGGEEQPGRGDGGNGERVEQGE